MIWGCFVSNKLGPIVFVDGTVNQYVYMDILREQLPPFLDALWADDFMNIVFQQDNARPHAAKNTQKFLQ